MNSKKLQGEIRQASAKDRDVLIDLFLKYLKFLDQFEHDLLPTRKNAEVMIDTVFLPAAKRGEPILIAWNGDEPIGVTFWVVQNLPYELRWKVAVGYGTYIEPKYRSKKLGTQLRKRGIEILKSLGVQRLLGAVHLKNTISVKANSGLGGIPWARMDLFKLQD
jgi:GNAT superfamily N-acetyltransferase